MKKIKKLRESNSFLSNWDQRIVKDPFVGSLLSHLYYYPVPTNLNYFWGLGSLLGCLLVIQIITGVLLSVHYTADVSFAFYSVEFIMRNVEGGWFVRYMHSSGASLLFITLYAHILRSIYYRTFRNIATWLTGLILFLLMMATGFLGYILVWGQMCAKSVDIELWEEELSQEQYIGKRYLCFEYSLLKHMFIVSSNKLIRKNLINVSILGRRWYKISLGILVVVSNVSSGMKAFFNTEKYKKTKMNKWTRGNLNGYGFVGRNFARHYKGNVGCWRGTRRSFCSDMGVVKLEPYSEWNGTLDFTKYKDVTSKKKTVESIGTKDLDKRVVIYSNNKSIIEKLSTFKMDKCGKYINITKEFLCDPMFLKFAYYLIRNGKGIHAQLDGLNDKWFKKTAELLKNGQYKFKPAKQEKISKAHKDRKRVITITNGRDRIIQKAMAIVLELIYEKFGVFHDESHGFRPNRGCHTALSQIKFTWTAVPYYIEADISKAFDDINRNVLINILKEKISDKRFMDLLCKMYNVGTLCPEKFWIKKINGVMQGNVLSPILCNIYLNKLDDYVKDGIIAKYEKGDKPIVNREYLANIGLKNEERTLPTHIQNTIKKSRRRQVEKRGIKRILESTEYTRIKYVRYADDFIIGVRGSLELAKEIKQLIKNFLKRVLHLELNDEKTRVTNTYGDRAKFLGMLIFNKNASDLPYRNSRRIENAKRVAKKNKIIRENATMKILKNTRANLIKALDSDKDRVPIVDLLKDIELKGDVRERIRDSTNVIHKANETEKVPELKVVLKGPVKTVPKTIPKKIPINKLEIMRRIHSCLTACNAVSTNLAVTKRMFPGRLKTCIGERKFTYCPETIKLNEKELAKLIKVGQKTENKYSSTDNWIIVINKLLQEQQSLNEGDNVTMMNSKSSEARIQVLEDGVNHSARPVIIMDREKIYTNLMFANIMNRKKNPSCKANIASTSDFNIIAYFNTVAHGMLSYYRCADDFYKTKSIVNWFVRYSAISTIKYKHKLASRKAVIDKYGIDLKFNNHKGKSISLISTKFVMALKKEFLSNPWTRMGSKNEKNLDFLL
jgi:group II intron reverse transcriptase/maturase